VTIAVRSDAEWRALCGVIGRPELADDPRFATESERHRRQDELDAIIAAWTAGLDAHEAMARLQAAGVPAGAVLDGRDLATNPHLEARGFFPRLTHSEAGTHPYPGQPIRLSGTPAQFRSDAPLLGEHNAPLLRDLLGMTEAAYTELEQRGVIGDTPPA
jgi:crotonobetainyl-CoA:carnitine CoA-transferase CaiB-like acyl-CoA transferase